MKNLVLIVCLVFSISLFGQEYSIQQVPNPKTTNSKAYVSNPDGILKSETVNELNVILDSLSSQTGVEVSVVMLNSIGQADYFSFATELFKLWGIGKEKQDNGLLVLFVLDQKKLKIETGYGLEGVVTDALATRVRTQTMNPEFKKGDYDAGILNGVKRLVSIIKKEPVTEEAATPIAWNEILPIAAGIYLILIIMALVWVNNIVRKVKADTRYPNNIARYKAIKSQKNAVTLLISVIIPILAFVAFILIKFPLHYILLLLIIPFTTLPASLYGKFMMWKIRRQPIACNECDGQMHLLSEKQEDTHLKLSQQFEEQLHAVDYDVFVCDSCKNEAIFTLDKPSAYSNCPKCGTKAFIQKEKHTIVAPTYISSGTQRTTYHCKFCGYEENHNDKLPRLQRNNSAIVGGAVAGSMFSGRGGFGGGGGFSGGSFGGGLSGGGGSGGGW